MAPGMGFALDDAQQELAEDLGNAESYFASKGTDGISRALHETNPAEREALARNLDGIESKRAQERSEDLRTSADFERAVAQERESAQDARDRQLGEHAAREATLTYEQYRRQQEAAEREQLVRREERAQLANQALLDMAFPERRQRQTQELNRQAREMADANLLPSELVRQGRVVEAIDKLSTYSLEASVQRHEMQLRQAITDDINRRMQVDPNTAAAVQHFADSLAKEAQLAGADPTQYVRDGALRALATGQRDGVSPADALVRASRFRGYQTPAEIQAWNQEVGSARQQLTQERREAEEGQRQKLFKQAYDQYWGTDRQRRAQLVYDPQFMDLARKSGFVKHLTHTMSKMF